MSACRKVMKVWLWAAGWSLSAAAERFRVGSVRNLAKPALGVGVRTFSVAHLWVGREVGSVQGL